MDKLSSKTQEVLAGSYAETLMRELATWSNTTTIVLHGGCVFEFKGQFPEGSVAEGYYNLGTTSLGFQGHIDLAAIDYIGLQEKNHRGRKSLAFTFQDQKHNNIFKVFLGRDDNGELLAEQVAAFNYIKQTHLT